MPTTILRHVGDALRNGFRRRLNRDPLAVEVNLARVAGRNAEEDARKFRAARADQAGQADDFSRANIEGDIVHPAGRAAKVLEGENYFAGHAFGGRIDRRDLAPDHQLDEFGLGNGSRRCEGVLFNFRFPIADC